jgi:hypothetical protein
VALFLAREESKEELEGRQAAQARQAAEVIPAETTTEVPPMAGAWRTSVHNRVTATTTTTARMTDANRGLAFTWTTVPPATTATPARLTTLVSSVNASAVQL